MWTFIPLRMGGGHCQTPSFLSPEKTVQQVRDGGSRGNQGMCQQSPSHYHGLEISSSGERVLLRVFIGFYSPGPFQTCLFICVCCNCAGVNHSAARQSVSASECPCCFLTSAVDLRLCTRWPFWSSRRGGSSFSDNWAGRKQCSEAELCEH